MKTIDELEGGLSDAAEYLELAVAENDESSLDEIISELEGLEAKVADLEFRRMFSGEMDASNAYLDINSGSGGTEAQDWANMILRMYLRFAEKKGFSSRNYRVF